MTEIDASGIRRWDSQKLHKSLLLFPGSHTACKTHLHKPDTQHLLPCGDREGFHVYRGPGGLRLSFSSYCHGDSARSTLLPIYWEGYYDHYHAVREKGRENQNMVERAKEGVLVLGLRSNSCVTSGTLLNLLLQLLNIH